MPITVNHILSATTPDNTSYEIRPSHWNSVHTATMSAAGSEVIGAFSNGGNVTFGLSANGYVTASAPSGGGAGGVAISGAGNSVSTGTVVFSNSNNVSFGMAGSTITATATVAAQTNQSLGIYASSQTFGQSSSSTYDARSLSVVGSGGVSVGWSNSSLLISGTTYPAQSNQSAIKAFGASNTGNTAGNTGVSTGVDWVLAGSNNVTVSESTVGGGPNTLWISGPTVGGAQTGISGIIVSDATYTSGTVSFSNAGNVTISSSVNGATQYIRLSGNPAQTNQSLGIYGSSQTFGQSSSSTYDARSLSVVGSGGVSVGWSNSSFLISGQTTAAQTNQTIGLYGSSQTTGSASSGTYDARSISIIGAGIVSVGNHSTSAGGTTTGLIISATQSNQAFSAQGGSSAFQTLTFTNSNNVSFSNTGGSVWGSYALNVSATGGTSNALSGLTFKDSQGVSFGLSTGAGVGTITASVAAQSNQSAGIYNSSQTTGGSSSSTYDARSLSIVYSGNISGGWTNSSLLLNVTTAAQTNQTAGIYNSSQTTGGSSSSTYDARSLSIVYSGNISGGWTNSSLLLNVTTAAQTNQTVGVYGSSQTTGSASSGTYDARSISIIGAGIISVGNHSTSAGGTTTGVIISATQSNQAFSAAGGSSAFQTLGFSDNAAASWTNTNGSVAIASVRASMYATSNTTQSSTGTANLNSLIFAGAGIASVGITNGSVVVSVPSGGGAGDGGVFAGVSTAGNTAGSTGTVSTGNFVLVGTGALTLSQSTAAAGSAATVTLSVPQTSSLVGVNGISISTNGSTISISNQQYTASFFEPEVYGGTTTNAPSNGTLYVRPFYVNNYVNANQLRILQQIASQSATTIRYSASVSAGSASSGTASFGLSGTALIFTRLSTGTNANSSLIVTYDSGSYSYGIGISDSVSWSTNASSMTASWTNSQAISFISSMDSIGGITTGSFGTSSSSTFSSTSTNANSISSTFTNSFMSQVLSQVRPILIPIGTTLSPGEYWLGIIHSTNTGSTNYSHQNVLIPGSYGLVYYTTNSTGYAEIGSSGTIASSNLKWGIGSYSSSGNTTATSGIPISQISNTSGGFGNASLYFNFVGQVK